MKELNFLKRLSAITLAAAITAANVGFDFLPTAKKAAAEPKEENTVTEVKTPKVMTQKSKYPTSLSFIVEKNEDGESVLRASNPTVFNRYFTAELISLDPPAEGEEAEQLVFSAEGTVIRKGGNYTVNVKARINEETGELVYNPYKMISGGITIAEETAVPEAETINQEIAVIEDGEIVEEAAEVLQEVISEEIISEEPAEIPVITETSVNICESDVNAANGMFDMSQSQKLDYTVVKSQDSYNVMIPDDYDELFLNGIDEEGNAFFNAAGEEVQVNFNEIEMNIQVVNFAELKIKDIAEPEDYSIERFCGEETLPYYYGEIVKVTPSSGYNIVVGDMKFSDAVSVAINDVAFTTEGVAINVYEGENISGNFTANVNGNNVTVTINDNVPLNGMKYTLSVALKNGKADVKYAENKALTFSFDDVVVTNDVIRVNAAIEGVKAYSQLSESDEIKCPCPTKPLIDYVNGDMTDATWYANGKLTAARLSFTDGTVKINEVTIKSKTGKPYATYDANGKLTGGDSSIISDDANVTKGSWEFFINPAGVNNLHEDLYIDVEYDIVKEVEISFGVTPDDGSIIGKLNGTEFKDVNNDNIDQILQNDNDTEKNKVTFEVDKSWDISNVALNGKKIKIDDNNAIDIDSDENVKKQGTYIFTVTLKKKTVKVTVTAENTELISIDGKEPQDIDYGSVNYGSETKIVVQPKFGYYVKSIKKGETDIFNTENNENNKVSFNTTGYGYCEVGFTEEITEDTEYKVEVAEVADSNITVNLKGIDAKFYNKEENTFTIYPSQNEVKLTFGDNLLYDYENNKPVNGVKTSYAAKETEANITLTDEQQEMTYYVVNGYKIEKVKVTIKRATANPKITGFKVEQPTTDKILNILTFGIFSNDTINITVTAALGDNDNDDLVGINDIKLYNGKIDEGKNEITSGNDLQNNSKTFTLSAKGTYDLKAQATVCFKNNKDEFVGEPIATAEAVINVAGNQLNVESYEYKVDPVNPGNGIPVYIDKGENAKPTVGLNAKDPIVVNGENWYKGNATVDLTASDADSGINKVIYSVDEVVAETTAATTTATVNVYESGMVNTYTTSIEIPAVTSEVKHYNVNALAVDNAGNESVAEPVQVHIDAAPPVITLDTENFDEWRNTAITYYFTVDDKEGAGIFDLNDQDKESVTVVSNGTQQEIKVDYAEDDTDHTKYKFTVSPDFQGTVTITAVDKVGNRATATTSKLKTEDNAPSVRNFSIKTASGTSEDLTDLENSYDKNFKYYFNVVVDVTIDADDVHTDDNGVILPDSGIKEIYLGTVNTDENGNYDLSAIKEFDLKPIYVDENGIHATYTIEEGFEGLLLFRVKDHAGNISKWMTPEMLIAEDLKNHGDHSEASIILPETPYSNGNPLYDNAPEITLNLRDSASGIDMSSINCQIGEKTVSNIEWNCTYKRNVVTNATAIIKCPDLDENGINITLEVTDNAGNQITAESRTISIDKSEPDISVTFNPVGSANQEFFNKQRTATVLAKDRNLRLDNLRELIDVTVTNALGTSAEPCKITQDWKMVENIKEVAGKPVEAGEEVYKCEITFVQDAEYSFAISAEDLTNKTKKSETFKFTIDTTAPKLSITFDNNSKSNDKYYNAGRKATLTINEHNFAKNKDSVKSVLSAKDADGLTVMDSKEIYDGKLTWTQSKTNKDEWTAQVNFNKEGTFDFSMAYTDPAGNSGNNADSGEFVIDTTAPKIEQSFTKSGNKLATNSDLVPHVIFSDYNFLSENQIGNNCKVTIRKFGENGLSSENFSATSRSYTSKNANSPVTFEQIFDIFDKEIEVDGIYEITIRAEDLAGNVTEINDLTVSINRFGPTYMILNEEARKAVEKYAANEIPIKDNIGLEIAEVNVTPLSGKGIVRVSVDGTSINELEDGFETSENRVSLADDVWEENENGWYQTIYKIDKKNFEKDGKYRVTLESEDEAGNKYLSDSATSPRTNFAASFAVDTTEPTVIIAGADEEEYKETELELTVKLSDINSYSIDELEFYPDNKENSTFYVKINDEYHDIDSLKKQCEGEISKDASGDIVIKMMVKASEKNQKQNIDVFIKDKAGNQTIGTESFILWNTNNWFMIIIIAAGVIILCTAVFFVTKKVRKH